MTLTLSEAVGWMFIVCHLGMEALAGVAADLGYMSPTYLFIGIMLLAYLIYLTRRRQPWYKLFLLFVPILGGIQLDEMFDDFSDNLAEKQPLLAFLVPIAVAIIYTGLCTYLNPGLSHS